MSHHPTNRHIVDFLSDAILITLPLWLVLTTQIRHRRTRTLLLAVFCSNIVTLAISCVYLFLYLSTKKRRNGLLLYVIMSHLQVRGRLSSTQQILNCHQAATGLMVANLVVDVLVINRLLRKATGLRTFSDNSDTEVITDNRAVETTPNPHSDDSGDDSRIATISTSLGTMELTPISSAMYSESRVDTQAVAAAPFVKKGIEPR